MAVCCTGSIGRSYGLYDEQIAEVDHCLYLLFTGEEFDGSDLEFLGTIRRDPLMMHVFVLREAAAPQESS